MTALCIVLLTLLGGVALYFSYCILKQQEYLETICEGQTGKFLQTTNLWKQIRNSRGSYQFSGLSSQRKVILEYFYRWRKTWDVQTDAAPDERLEIRFPVIQKFWLRMILDPDHEMQKEAVLLDIPELDSLYIVHSNQPEAAREFISSQAALVDLRRLPYPFDRLEIHQGCAEVEFFFPARRKFDRIHLEIAVEALARLFSEYEAHSKLVIVATSSPDTRCPYCRELFAESGSQIRKCVECGADVHESCWKENRQCTTWGCQSTVAAELEQR
ncbi:hypothetical protein L0222_12550 [bacterium]|nr:hypothetical protein [bacterium]MCI0601998.1 hypothetical protein [bacterium]